MGRVTIALGGRSYALSCADGEETHLAALGDLLRAKADELTAAIGTMSEPRLLLMAGLQVADDLVAARAVGCDAPPMPPDLTGDLALTALLTRIEALAETLEG